MDMVHAVGRKQVASIDIECHERKIAESTRQFVPVDFEAAYQEACRRRRMN